MTHNAVRTDPGEAGPGSWVDQTGRVDGSALIYEERGGPTTNRSGTLTTAATAQTIMQVNTARRYLFIENLDSTEDLWFNFNIPAVRSQPSVLIRPYGSFVMEGSFVSTEAISVIATTAAHAFTAKEAG